VLAWEVARINRQRRSPPQIALSRNGIFKEANVLPVLFPREWDAEKKAWKDKDDAPTDWEAYEEFDRDIRFVSVDRKTGLVTLMIEWKDPIRAAQWANKFVNMANTRLRTEAVEDAEKSIVTLRSSSGLAVKWRFSNPSIV